MASMWFQKLLGQHPPIITSPPTTWPTIRRLETPPCCPTLYTHVVAPWFVNKLPWRGSACFSLLLVFGWGGCGANSIRMNVCLGLYAYVLRRRHNNGDHHQTLARLISLDQRPPPCDVCGSEMVSNVAETLILSSSSDDEVFKDESQEWQLHTTRGMLRREMMMSQV